MARVPRCAGRHRPGRGHDADGHVQQPRRPRPGGRRAVGAGREPVPAPGRPHPEPGLDRPGRGRLREVHPRGGDPGPGERGPGEPRQPAQRPRRVRALPAGPGRPLERPLPPHGGRRAIPRAQGQPELPRPAGRPRGHGEPDRGRAQPLQREGPGVQHGPPAVPDRAGGEAPGLRREGLLQGGGRSRQGPERRLQLPRAPRRRPSSGRDAAAPWCAPLYARSSPPACWPAARRG